MHAFFFKKILPFIMTKTIYVALIAWASLCFFMKFFKENHHYITKHPKGTLIYIVKTFLIILAIIPNAFSISLAIIALLAEQVYYKYKKSTTPKIEPLGNLKNADNLVYLIHGTYEPKAQWVFDSESKLRKHIENSFGGNVEFCSLSWSGRNSEKDRRLAANELINCIKEKTNKYTNQHIICHSHGGNIVLDAVGRMGGRDLKGVRRIAFLSVPVINILEKEVSKIHFQHYAIAALAVTLLPATYLLEIITNIPMIFIWFFIAITIYMKSGWIKNKLNNIHSSIDEEAMSYQTNKRIKTASRFYTCFGDEAKISLEIASILSNITSSTFGQAATAAKYRVRSIESSKLYDHHRDSIADKIKGIFSNTNTYFNLLGIFYASLGIINITNRPNDYLWTGVMLLISAYFISRKTDANSSDNIALQINFVNACLFFISNTLMSLAFGNLKYMASVKYAIYPSSTPKGKWTLHTDKMAKNGLSHSSHSHDELISDVAEWITTRKNKFN